MILLLDLNRTPDGPTAAESRKAIDIAFALCGPYGGIVGGGTSDGQLMQRPLTEGGREAWEYFGRLRTKAWQKAGLDPDIVWTRQQAMNYCSKQSEPEVVSRESGPMRNQPSPVTMEGLDPLGSWLSASGPELGISNQSAMSPPNIDWTFLDAVLGDTQQQMDLGFGIDPEDPGEGAAGGQ